MEISTYHIMTKTGYKIHEQKSTKIIVNVSFKCIFYFLSIIMYIVNNMSYRAYVILSSHSEKSCNKFAQHEYLVLQVVSELYIGPTAVRGDPQKEASWLNNILVRYIYIIIITL